MAQEITTTGNNAIVAHAMYARVGALHASIERDAHYRDTLPAPITPAVRKELESYRKDLHARLRPISMAQGELTTARQAIGVLLQSYMNARSADPKGTLDAYVAMLRDQPVWAILAALDDFRQRRVFDLNSDGDKVFFTLDHAPSAIRILDQVKKHTDAIEEERGRVVRLLAVAHYAAPPVPPEESERLGKLLADLADNLQMKSAAIRKQDGEKIRAEADAARERAKRITEDARKRRVAADHASQDQAAEAYAG